MEQADSLAWTWQQVALPETSLSLDINGGGDYLSKAVKI